MVLVSERVGQLFHDDHRLEYTEYGGGERWVVLVPAQLMARSMHQSLARTLAGAGARVVTLDPLGHGRSDRPADPLAYSVPGFAEQVVALLDHLGAREAIVGGTSLGANVALEVAVLAPDRVRGLLLEAPVLDNAVAAGTLANGALLTVSRIAPLLVDGVRLAGRLVPRRLTPLRIAAALDSLDQRPGPLAAMVHGILFGRTAPPSRERRAIEAPALVVGHARDPVHPEADAQMLADELVASRYAAARTPWEWRLRPARLDRIAVAFVEECEDGSAGQRLRSG